MPDFAVANLCGGKQNGSNQIYYFQVLDPEIKNWKLLADPAGFCLRGLFFCGGGGGWQILP